MAGSLTAHHLSSNAEVPYPTYRSLEFSTITFLCITSWVYILPAVEPSGSEFQQFCAVLEQLSENNVAKRRLISRLDDHPSPYVTVSDLAEYWAVSRKQIYKHIELGTLTALRFGPRLLRIQTSEARRFEREARMIPLDEHEHARPPQHLAGRPSKTEATLPRQKSRVKPIRG